MNFHIDKSKKTLFPVLLIFLFVSVLLLSEHAFVQQTSALTNPGGEWTSFTFDNNDSRYQAASTITSSNVGSLKEAWFFPANHSVTSTPTVQNGHAYFSDWGGNVYSLNINTGSDTGTGDWKTNVGFPISSSPQLANGLVYVAGSPLFSTSTNRTMLFALYQSNGTIAWSRILRHGPGGIYSSPIVYNGLVYVGESDCHERYPNGTLIPGCSEFAKSNVGEIFATNALTGKSTWNFTTGNETTGGGWGAGVWGSVVIDPSLNSIYFGTGNSYVDTSTSCTTCSLYAYSIISLNAATGKLNWYKQVIPNLQTGDDDDFGSTPNLFSFVKAGVTYYAIGLMIKSGNYYVLNRENGILITTLKLSSSTSANVGVGGFIYPSGTVNPEIFYPAGSGYIEALEPSSSTSPLWTFHTSGIMDGSEVALVPGAVLVGDGSGYLYAINMSSHTALYDKKLPGIPTGYGIYSGVTAAEGFVLVGDYDAVAKESSTPNSAGLYAFSVPSSSTTTTVSTSSSSSSSSTSLTSSSSSSSSTSTSSSSSTTSVTTTSSTSSTSSFPFGIDGSASTQSSLGVSSLSVALSTSYSPDVVIVYAFSANTGVTMSVSGASLTWNVRTSYVFTGYGTMYEFYAIAPSTLTSTKITVTQSKSDSLDVIAFGISGANTASPFDPSITSPPIATGSSTSPSVSVSTSNANELILGFLATQGNPSKTADSGFTLIKTTTISPSSSAEQKIVSSIQSNFPVGYTLGTSEHWAIIGDAIVQGTSGITVIPSTSAFSFLSPILIFFSSLIGVGLLVRSAMEEIALLNLVEASIVAMTIAMLFLRFRRTAAS